MSVPARPEARALAAFLRDRDSSAVTAVGPHRVVPWHSTSGKSRGSPTAKVQSLPQLERILTRLRLAGADHRSPLVTLAI